MTNILRPEWLINQEGCADVYKYGVRSRPKFIVWILNSSLKFLLEFYSRIKILRSSFRFRIIRKRFYTRLLFCILNSLLLARRIFSTRFIKLHLLSHISNLTLKIFNTTSEFSFTLQWSLIKTICRGVGVGRGWLFNGLSCFAPFVQTYKWSDKSTLSWIKICPYADNKRNRVKKITPYRLKYFARRILLQFIYHSKDKNIHPFYVKSN